jgi:hypothetical protein
MTLSKSTTKPTSLSTLFLLALAACSSSSAGNSAAGNDAGSATDSNDIDIPTETAATATRGTTTTSLEDTKAVSEMFVQEDPTIDPSRTAGANADAITAQVSAMLGEDGGACASARITHAAGDVTVSVNFASGCTIAALGITVAGSVSASVSESAGATTISFTFTNLDVNSRTINGTASQSTTNGTTYTSRVNITDGTQHITFTGTESPDSNDKGLTLSGTGTYQDGVTAALSFTATGVHLSFGACYADAGTLTFQENIQNKRDAAVSVTETITFESTTPTNGQAQVTVDGQTSTTSLPTYGSCPP